MLLLHIVMILVFLLMSVNFSSMESNSLHLNYVIFQNPPFDTLIRGPNGTYKYYGSSFNIISWMAQRHKYTFGLVLINETLADEKGTHEALFYQLINDKDIDGIASGFYLTLDRKEKMDFTFFALAEGFALVVPTPGEESRLFAFIRPFQSMVWLMIIASIISAVVMMTYFGWFYYYYYTNDMVTGKSIRKNANTKDVKIRPEREAIVNSWSLHLIYVINILTNQGGKERFYHHSFRILAGMWLLAGMVLVNSYSGIVISSLTVPKMKPSIESLEDLVASEEVGVVLRSDVSTGEQILKATSGVYKAIGDKARSKPDQIFADPFKLNAKLITGRYAFPFLQTFCKVFVGVNYKKDGHCRFKTTNLPSFSTGYYHFLAKKGSSYAYMFNKGYMDLYESGLLRFWIKEKTPQATECFTKSKRKSASQVPIRLLDLVSAFLILGTGLGLALLSFLLEFIYSKLKRNTL